MNQVQIQCIADRVEIPDLGLVLRRGQIVPLTSDEVSRSEDLKTVRALGRVGIVSNRPTTAKPDSQRVISRAGAGPSLGVDPSPVPAGDTETVVLLRAILAVLQGIDAKLDRPVTVHDPTPTGTNVQSPTMSAPEPTFIPGGFVGDSVTVAVPSSVVSASNFDETRKALRAARQR